MRRRTNYLSGYMAFAFVGTAQHRALSCADEIQSQQRHRHQMHSNTNARARAHGTKQNDVTERIFMHTCTLSAINTNSHDNRIVLRAFLWGFTTLLIRIKRYNAPHTVQTLARSYLRQCHLGENGEHDLFALGRVRILAVLVQPRLERRRCLTCRVLTTRAIQIAETAEEERLEWHVPGHMRHMMQWLLDILQ